MLPNFCKFSAYATKVVQTQKYAMFILFSGVPENCVILFICKLIELNVYIKHAT